MALTKRCPNCGASNPENADWCSLCLERFPGPEPAEPESPEPESPEPEPVPEPGPPGPPGPPDPATTAGVAGAGSTPPASPQTDAPATPRSSTDAGTFRVTEEGIRWACPTCGTTNDLDRVACEVCGTTFAETVRPKAERPPRDPGKAALFSLFFPGAGHAYVGMWGQAVARAVLSLWVLLVAVVGILDKKVPGSLIMALLFGLAALGLWLVAAHDAFREASNDAAAVLLRGKRFLYVVLGLMALLFVAMLVALMTARSRAQDSALSIPSWPSMSSPIYTEHPTD